MTDEEIVLVLRSRAAELAPSEVASLLSGLAEAGLTHGTLVTYFKRAFPGIPLRLLLEAGTWKGVGGADSDETFNQMLGPEISKNIKATP